MGAQATCGRLRARPTNQRSPILSAKNPGRGGVQAPQPTRRQRREAARRAQAGAPHPNRKGTSSPAWKSPTVLITVAAVIVAVVVIAFLNVRPGGTAGAGAGSSSAASTDPVSGGGSATVTAPAASLPAGVTQDGRSLGSSTAKVALDVWEDFQCPACGNFTRQIEPTIIDRYVTPGNVRLTFHDFAFIGQESLDAASAARCAGAQGQFWPYHDWLFANQNGENQGQFSRDRLATIAARIGLDGAAWAACYDGTTQHGPVTTETAQGQTLGIQSTPTLFIDGKIVDLTTFSSWDDLYKAIDAAIAAAGSAAPSSSAASTAP